jgi:hypothetical protein
MEPAKSPFSWNMDFSLFWAGLTQFAGFLAVLQTQ